MTAKNTFLGAFDRLYQRAAAKLDLEPGEGDSDVALKRFSERFEGLLAALDRVPSDAVPPSAIAEIEEAVDGLSRQDLASLMISIPLAQQGQLILHQLAAHDVERRMLDHVLAQAEDRFGGN